jgi:hypothetical protein
MKTVRFPIPLVLCFAITGQTMSAAAAPTSSGRVVRVDGTVNAPLSEVWRVFTTSEGAQEFFAEKANIRVAIGGPYEIQFDPTDERSGTKGLKILSYAPEEMISFQWNARRNCLRSEMAALGLSSRCAPLIHTRHT